MEGDVIDPLAKAFFALMDNHSQDWASVLHEDAVLDWFGRCSIGIKQIRSFVRECIDQPMHSIDSIKSCPPIRHRCLKLKSRKQPGTPEEIGVDKEPVVLECGQGDGWGISKTPPDSKIPYDESILNAPRVKTLSDFKLDKNQTLNFSKIKGTLKLLHTQSFEGDKRVVQSERKIKHIIIGYSNSMVKLVVYKALNNCKRSLCFD